MPLPDQLPVLTDEVVTLRAFTDDDAEVVAEASGDPLIPLITSVPTEPNPVELLSYIERQHQRVRDGSGYSFAIADGTTDTAVGQIGLWLRNIDEGRASVGYWIAPSARRHGYARRALKIISEWGLSLDGIARLELYVEPWNEASWRAAERAGYHRVALLPKWQNVGSERRDMYLYLRLDPRRG